MDTITFADVLTHYKLKAQEAIDNVSDIKVDIRDSMNALEDGWKGSSADACRVQLEEINTELSSVESELSEIINNLTTICNAFADGTLPMV